MFRQAYATAAEFTRPVVLSRCDATGRCGSTIGTFVVLNDEGWILTAAHLVEALSKMVDECDAAANRPAAEAAIKADTNLKPKEKYDRVKALGKPKPTDTTNCSAWWASDTAVLTDVTVYDAPDLAIGRLDGFDLSTVGGFPTIKDPAQGIDPGTSLCKLGFPFHSILPTFDPATKQFTFPPGALPLPMFPIEGMMTREAEIGTHPNHPPPFPFRLIEVSTPGLKGQSGGPIFDTNGTVWGIQSSTMNLPLGFDPVVPNGGGRTEHQFLNVGLGVHPATICGALDSLGVKYHKSAY